MNVIVSLLLIGACLGVTANSQHVIQFSPVNQAQLGEFTQFGHKNLIDFLSHPSASQPFFGLLAIDNKEQIVAEAKKNFDVEAKDVTDNIQKQIQEQNTQNDKARSYMRLFRAAYSPPLNYYANLDEIYNWMTNLAKQNPNVQLTQIGQSFERRPMYVLKINSGRNLPIIFVESTIHCREWLSPATTMYIIDKILNGYRSDVYSKYELQFSLITNPDGYQYTHQFKNSIEGRFWRKNRRPIGSCYGADLNRNFDIYFGTVGVDHDCRSAVYCGPKAFSEPETQNLRNYVLGIAKNVKMYLSIHTFGQMIIVPYTYTTNPPADNTYLRRIAQIGSNAFLQTGGRRFYVGNTQELGLGLVSGSSVDWAKDKAGISTAFALELQPRGVNAYQGGFNPPASSITPSGMETLAGVTAMLSNL